MAYGRRDGFSYADGVPLKLNDRLQPPPQIVLPSFNYDSPNYLEKEYDYSVEQRALKQYQEHRQAKEAQEKAKADKVAQEIEQFAKVPLDTGQQLPNTDASQPPSRTNPIIANSLNPSPEGKTGEQQNERSSTLPAWQTATLLNPQPLVNENSTTVNKKVASKQFNLADFENQGFSPFDTMELQSINDLEELNTVFQGLAGPTPARAEQGKVPYENQGTYPKAVYQPVNGYQILPDMKQYHRHSASDKTHQGYYNGYSVYNYPLPSVHGLPSAGKVNEDELFPRLKSSKSTPDIRDEIIQQTNWNRSQTPPPYALPYVQVPASREQTFESPLSQQQTTRSSRSVSLSLPAEDRRIPPTNTSSPPAVTQTQEQQQQPLLTERLPNPYHELEEKQQLFAAKVAQMGFDLDRVARTVKHLGTDDKKVFDLLCNVQRLEESGYDGNDAETAFHLYDYNFQEAKRFLDLLKQFQDLGFQKNAARVALIRYKNDRDRALDSLLLS